MARQLAPGLERWDIDDGDVCVRRRRERGEESGEPTLMVIAQRGALEPDDTLALDRSGVPAASAERFCVVRPLDHVDDLEVLCVHVGFPTR